MKLILEIASITILWSLASSAFEPLVLLRPPGLDEFFLQLNSEMDPTEVVQADPILKMSPGQRTCLCRDVRNAKLFLTPGDNDTPRPDKFLKPIHAVQDYKEMSAFVANRPVTINLLNCPEYPDIYISYGYNDRFYFLFIKANNQDRIQLVAIIEPSPIRMLSYLYQDDLNSAFWKDTKNVGITTWVNKIAKFRSMSKSQQFRLCGLAYTKGAGIGETANIYEIALPNDSNVGPFLPGTYGIIESGVLFHLSPALPCSIRVADKSAKQKPEFFVIPSASDDHSVYLTELDEVQLMDVRLLKLTHYFTKVSSQYGNKEQFREQKELQATGFSGLLRRLFQPTADKLVRLGHSE